MSEQPDPPSHRLAYIPLTALLWHEQTQPTRSAELLPQIASQGIRQPIKVAASYDGRFVIVDGAHRAAAAHSLHWQTVPADLVVIEPAVLIPGWTHAIHHPGHRLQAACTGLHGNHGPVVAVVGHDQRHHTLRAASSLPLDLVNAYRAVASAYQALPYTRLGSERYQHLTPIDACVHWHLPRWRAIVQLAHAGMLLPAGVTRTAAIHAPGNQAAPTRLTALS